MELCKIHEEEDRLYVEAAVLVPEVVDQQGDVISAEEIKKARDSWMLESQTPGLNHEWELDSEHAYLVESRLLKDDETLGSKELPAGSWVVMFRVVGDDLKKAVKEGELSAFSIGGIAGDTE